MTFALYGPSDAGCAGTAVFTSTVDLTVTDDENGTATGTATSGSFTPTAAGAYRWIATYTGDDNNLSVAGDCNDPNEQSVLAGNNPRLDKISNPPSGSAVQPGSTIDYTVTVGNTGDVAITNAAVTDILPAHVTVMAGTISDGAVLADGVITWHVDLAPGATHTFTYEVTVDGDAPQNGVLVNTARFCTLQDTTTHVRARADLALVKDVSPVAGTVSWSNFGDKLTYNLTVTATGGLNQPTSWSRTTCPVGTRRTRSPVTRPTSPAPRSASVPGTCTVTGPDANGLITWHLGAMAAGTTRQVTFQVTIKDVTGGARGETVAVDIINGAAVRSDRTPTTPSNVVVTPVSKVLPVKIPRELPHTGALLVGRVLGGAVLLLGLGLVLLTASRRRGHGKHRG